VLRPERGFDGAAAARSVGAGESVSATARVLPHLTHREHAYMLPLPFTAPGDTFPEGTLPTIDRSQADGVDVVISRLTPSEDVVPPDFKVVKRFPGVTILRRAT
jgi:hypothetical protein